MKKNSFYFNGQYWAEKDLSQHLHYYKPGIDIYAAYAKPSHNKAAIFTRWIGEAYKLNGTRPSVQSYNTYVFTLAFFAEISGRKAFCYITPSYNYFMYIDEGDNQ